MLNVEFQNLASWERWLRVALGVAMVWAGSEWVPGLPGIALRVFSAWPIVTGLLGWCPLYALFGFSTCKR